MTQAEKSFYKTCEKILDHQEKTLQYLRESIDEFGGLIKELEENLERIEREKRARAVAEQIASGK